MSSEKTLLNALVEAYYNTYAKLTNKEDIVASVRSLLKTLLGEKGNNIIIEWNPRDLTAEAEVRNLYNYVESPGKLAELKSYLRAEEIYLYVTTKDITSNINEIPEELKSVIKRLNDMKMEYIIVKEHRKITVFVWLGTGLHARAYLALVYYLSNSP